jgi:hypothetical protein
MFSHNYMYGNNPEEGSKRKYNILIDHIVAKLIKVNHDQSEELKIALIKLFLSIAGNIHCELRKQALVNVITCLYNIHICSPLI